ncbi:MAG: PadR family transcriptional regulator [Verrucomicrobiales bacterium]|nr:PadR family transcriptional regulator [Verrucomicrobiales bacterium]
MVARVADSNEIEPRMGDFFDNWTVQVRKGLIELCVLNALAERERYGYELVKTLVDIPGLGITEGTLYPLLSRLRLQGLVSTRLEESTEGPARKYYNLTDEGRALRSQMLVYLDELNRGAGILRKRGGNA